MTFGPALMRCLKVTSQVPMLCTYSNSNQDRASQASNCTDPIGCDDLDSLHEITQQKWAPCTKFVGH